MCENAELKKVANTSKKVVENFTRSKDLEKFLIYGMEDLQKPLNDVGNINNKINKYYFYNIIIF